ncbi:hypothetical protein [Pseudaeromonas pectinilytica]
MNNRLGKVLFWVLNALVLLFLAAAMSLPAMAAPVAADNTMGMVLMVTSVVLFCGFSIWPTRFIWALTLVIRIPVLVLILFVAGMGKLLMRIDHIVALTGRRVLEVGNDR